MTESVVSTAQIADEPLDERPQVSSPGWWAIVAICGGVTVLTIVLGTVLVDSGRNAEALFGLAGTALGAIAGLLAPSPISRNH